ncbi:MAG: 3-deoxy-manno-octulosonate cytidylyltransferase [Deltaproteobacteria bacterium]|nr:3-deoxy-manno-octulosonate cytidylyltransferase [Deltaproteobacteria bacterium]
MRAVGVIPARVGAGRFPGKALAPIAGLPMIQRVWEGAQTAKTLRTVLIATDDAHIADAAVAFGAEVVMTRPDHPTGSDRIAEVARGLDDEIIVDIQADEPLIEGFVIDAAVEALHEDPEAPMATVVHAADPAAAGNADRVKVVPLYFSRSPIPAQRSTGTAPHHWQHVGLYAYRRPFLLEFAALPRGPLERAEELEQLRALEHGHRIRCAIVEGWSSTPVDAPKDVAVVEARLKLLGRR